MRLKGKVAAIIGVGQSGGDRLGMGRRFRRLVIAKSKASMRGLPSATLDS
jgi:hypothetical protein